MGETYTTITQGKWTCIAESGDIVWMVCDYGNGPEGATYTWTKGGKTICLATDAGYDIDWGPVIEEGVSIDMNVYSVDGKDHYETKQATVTTINGKPDWTTLAVETTKDS